LALTPDGRRLVFVGFDGSRSHLYVRDVWGRDPARPIPHTVGADAPFLSPDGQQVAFWVRAAAPAIGWVLKKVPLEGGGAPLEVCKTTDLTLGANWGDDGHIVFAEAARGGLVRVPSDGGTPEVLTAPKPGELTHRLPQVLPQSGGVIFTVMAQQWDWESARVVVHRFGTDGWTEIVRGAADARYVPTGRETGHLVYFRRGRLMAVRFDPVRLEKSGDEVGLEADVMQGTNGMNSAADSGAAQAAVSSSGTLAYVAGGEVLDLSKRIVWVDRRGRVKPLQVPPKPYYVPRLSPDGRRVAVHTHQSDRRVWIHDLERPDSLMAVTPPELGLASAVWSHDGQRLAFGTFAGGSAGLFWGPLLGACRRLTAARATGDPGGGRLPPSPSRFLGAGRATCVCNLRPDCSTF
jgi:dipeptidyl aminopeptidase/acylaminoacyl peptidase